MTKTREIADILTGVTMTGDLTIDKGTAKIKLGAGANSGPHGIDFYDTDNAVEWGLYYRTGADTITFELGGTTAKLTLDTTGNLTAAGDITAGGNVISQVTINTQTGTTYTTVLTDQSKLVTLNNASAITLTIPANSSVAYPVGTKIDFAQLGAGQVTFAGAGGVTVNGTPTLKLRDRYSAATCIKIATDSWLLVGDLAES